MRRLEDIALEDGYGQLPGGFYAAQPPQPNPQPYLVSVSADAAALLDLDPAEARRPEFLAWCNGSALPPGARPIATLYAGHQFGSWVPQLGDGRAILLGEVRNARGERWEVQLKGAGRTPFSRGGDGRAVLRSTIREYLCSEAMHGLGIPTTRALAIVGSDAPVFRETVESAAVLVRLARSHVRFGHFEVFYHRGLHAELARLADYVIERDYPGLAGRADRHLALYREAVERTAALIAQWQAVGFAHGVMNTDNMSILGLTLDYGPFGFLEAYDPDHVCNHSDHTGRYAFSRQPQIAMWNLGRLGQALVPLADPGDLQAAVDEFPDRYLGHYHALMRAKLGLTGSDAADDALVGDWLSLLAGEGADHTLALRALAEVRAGEGAPPPALRALFGDRAPLEAWLEGYAARLRAQGLPDAERAAAMRRVNPRYVLRNHLAQRAIEAAEQERDFAEIDRLLALLRRPFDEQPEHAAYAAPAPAWARGITVSCSS